MSDEKTTTQQRDDAIKELEAKIFKADGTMKVKATARDKLQLETLLAEQNWEKEVEAQRHKGTEAQRGGLWGFCFRC